MDGPVMFENPREETYASKCFVGQAIGELEDLVKNGRGILQCPFDMETERRLASVLGTPLMPTRHISSAAVAGIVDATRNLVLGWCLDLERDGILGEGLTFTAEEKEVASSANYTINYNGPVGNSQIQQNTQSSTQTMSVSQSDLMAVAEFLDGLRGHIADLKMNNESTAQLEADIRATESQLKAPHPSAIVIRECLRSVRNILEGCVGSVLAAGLLARFPGIIG
jgi:AbiTii